MMGCPCGIDDDSKGKASVDGYDNDSDIIPFFAVLVKDYLSRTQNSDKG